MNKITIDNLKAHTIRMEVVDVLRELFKDSYLYITKFTESFKYVPPRNIAELNNYFNRFPQTKMQVESIGHSFLLGDKRRIDKWRILDIRFDNGCGIYWKDVNKTATFESLKTVNPIFIVVLKIEETITHIAGFDMENPFMNRKSYWQSGCKGNLNRLQNIKIPYSLKDQRGYTIINHKCPEFIEYLYKVF